MFPADFEIKTGFDAIRNLLKNHCSSQMGIELVNKMRFSSNPISIIQRIEQTSEFKSIIDDGNSFPEHRFCDISVQLKKMLTDGIFLTELELFDLKLSSEFIFQIKKFFNKKELKYPQLFILYKDIEIIDDITSIIDNIIDNKGEMRTDASPAYNKILKELKKTEFDIHKKLISVFNKAQSDGYTSDTGITIRNGRPVIPVKSEHKRKINGIVHDESGSGNVLYIEPSIIVEENNKLKHLELEKNRERENILKTVTNKLRPFRDVFEVFLKKISLTDFIISKALTAIKINAFKPKIILESNTKSLKLIDAYHPGLFLKLKNEDKKPELLSCTLNDKNRIMLISGPNAGGKSVALKTIAINQYMLQCGLLVCASADSEFSIFKNIMVDIGDNQSIDNNLSSYSAHLQAMKYFTKNAKDDTLFFIDELGSGTDPQFGGAIGEAILEKLNNNKALGVVTSHFSNIKNFAGQTEGFVNASMLYDIKNYIPLYKIAIGKPGSSYAIELAKKTGIEKNIIENAKKKAGTTHQRIDEILAEYEQLLQNTRKKLKSLEEKELVLEKLTAEYNELKEKLKERKNSIINEAKINADEIINKSRKLIENTINEIKRNAADKEITSKLRKKLADAQTDLKIENNKPETQTLIYDDIKEGTLINIKGFTMPGKVIKIGKENLLVETGLIKSRITFDMIESVAETIKPQKLYSIKGYDYRNTIKQFNPRIDVRGMNADDALNVSINSVDKALMLNIDKIWILHGKGDGILRKIIRQNLKQIKHVKSIESEHADFGGDGITIIELM